MTVMIWVLGGVVVAGLVAIIVWGFAAEKAVCDDYGEWPGDKTGTLLGMPVVSDETIILKRRYDDLFGNDGAAHSAPPAKIRTSNGRQ